MKSETKIIVRYAETDQMGIVHHSNYAIWFEAARTDLIKKIGMSYSEMEAEGVLVPLLELHCKYLKPALYEDELIVEARVLKVTPVKMEFGYRIFKDKELIHTGTTLHGLVGKDLKPVNMKKMHGKMYDDLLNSVEPE